MLSCRSAMLLSDKQGQIIHINTEVVNLSGYEILEIQGMKLTELMFGNETSLEKIEFIEKMIKQEKSHDIEIIQYRKNGEKMLKRMITVPIRGGYLRTGKFDLIS